MNPNDCEVLMAVSMKAVRRGVTGHDADGRSIFLFDGDVSSTPTSPCVTIAEIWSMAEAPVSNAASEDAAQQRHSLLPDPSGTLLRIFEAEPQERDTDLGFHTTDTVDYIYVISGEIHALVGGGEVLLPERDVLVQRGTQHAWINRSGQISRLLAVMIDAEGAGGARVRSRRVLREIKEGRAEDHGSISVPDDVARSPLSAPATCRF